MLFVSRKAWYSSWLNDDNRKKLPGTNFRPTYLLFDILFLYPPKRTVPAPFFLSRSTLVLEGEGLHLEGLELDGALVIKAGPGARVSVRGLKVSNEGWAMVPLPEDLSLVAEEDR